MSNTPLLGFTNAGVSVKWAKMTDPRAVIGDCHHTSLYEQVFLLGAWEACLLAIRSPCSLLEYTETMSHVSSLPVSSLGLPRQIFPTYRK